MAGLRQTIDILNQKGTPAFYTDTFANRPAFGFKGRVFIASDTQAIYEDTGTSWTLIANVGVSTTPNLQSVCAVGNTYSGDASFNLVAIGRGVNSIATNTNVGANSGIYALGTSNNVSIGYGAIGGVTSSGSNNVCVGYYAGNILSQGSCTFVGSGAGRYTNGFGNVCIGYNVDTQGSSGSYGGTQNTYIGYSIGSSVTAYTSYNVFIGANTASGYTGNGVNGLNTIIGSLVSVSASPTIQNNIILGDNNGTYLRKYASNNWVTGGGADNGIHAFQVTGGINASTMSMTGTTFSVSTTISSPSSANYFYVFVGAGPATLTLPTCLNNNNMIAIKNYSGGTLTIAAASTQFIVQTFSSSPLSSFNLTMGVATLISDGNNKYYQLT